MKRKKKSFSPSLMPCNSKGRVGGVSIGKSGMSGEDQCLYLIWGIEVRKRKNWYLKQKKKNGSH